MASRGRSHARRAAARRSLRLASPSSTVASMSKSVNDLGRLVMEQLRDKAMASAELALGGRGKAPRLRKLQADLGRLTDEQRAAALRLVRESIDSAIHDFLFALQEAHDTDESFTVLVHGEDVASMSDGLHGEALGKKGWQAKFSRYGAAPREA